MTDDDFRLAIILALTSIGIFLWLILNRLDAGLLNVQLYELPRPTLKNVAEHEKTE